MKKNLEERLNDESAPRLVRLNGKIRLDFEKSKGFAVGRNAIKGLIPITRPNITIDGSNAVLEVHIKDCLDSDTALFHLKPSAENVSFCNLTLSVILENPTASCHTFHAIHCSAPGMRITRSQIRLFSGKQINLIGISNSGNRDTHLSTLADNMVISDSTVQVTCAPDAIGLPCTAIGICNRMANSVSVQNSFVTVTNPGIGADQKAIGLYTDGRFGRFVGNNIKANATHNTGLSKEQGHACGFVNGGMYSLISANNLVGEWSGKSIGLDSRGSFAEISTNKILATHTVCGRSLCLTGNNSIVNGNILTSTSRNARLLELAAGSCLIVNNIMEVLIDRGACRSGVGIYAASEDAKDNIITQNILRNVKDCGILARHIGNVRAPNPLYSSPDARSLADLSDPDLVERLDEASVQSIT